MKLAMFPDKKIYKEEWVLREKVNRDDTKQKFATNHLLQWIWRSGILTVHAFCFLRSDVFEL